MKKIVEVEYVGIEDVQEILDDACALMQFGHYVSVEVGNLCGTPKVEVKVMFDGWQSGKMYDYVYEFHMDEKESSLAMMNSCKNTLKNLLAEG